ncbi:MAG: alpha-hydroxy-acid oxidizing protein, partial [Eubacteriales bacterium]|nr:alpha-hydroxy-acid oxidizing protein [Eubacteriales bacterium]
MDYKTVLENARKCIGENCKACPICDGRACGNKIPGPGAKGTGTVAIENYQAWQNISVRMDTLFPNAGTDTSLSIFGKTFRYPFFAGPVGAVNLHYSAKYN